MIDLDSSVICAVAWNRRECKNTESDNESHRKMNERNF
jgi:hypothetical protein